LNQHPLDTPLAVIYNLPMSRLSDIKKASVIPAIDEFDRVGRGEFLAKYGFGRAETYFLKFGDELYDSKAIVGRAYGYDFPEHGPLHSSEFSGGENTVEALLTGLGFEVVPDVSALLLPEHRWSRDEVLSRPSPVPAKKGVYAWYFREVPSGVPVAAHLKHNGYALLYVGIAPDKRRMDGKPSQERLRARIRFHFEGNAEGSTLRLSLGCLLGLELRRVGSGRRRTFGKGEKRLSEWMELNAFVAWIEHSQPWTVEKYLIEELSPPLNLKDNEANPFYPTLCQLRKDTRANADKLEVV